MSGSPLLTRAQMQALDRFAIEEVGIPSLVLMEVAARGVLDAVLGLHAENPGPVLVLAGPGNNGGDAACIARHLFEREIPVDLVVLGDANARSEELRHQLRILEALGLKAAELSGDEAVEEVTAHAENAAVVVDGLFGTGLARAVDGWRAALIEAVNAAAAPVVAIDIPSGIHADTGQVLGAAFEADVTVTFQYAQPGHVLYPGRTHAGDLRVVDIGLPRLRRKALESRAYVVDDRVIGEAVPVRDPNSHKGSFGHLWVVAGVPDRPGAALLCARAGLRAGAGLVTVASDSKTIARLAPALEELMGRSLGETRVQADRLRELVESMATGASALVVGPSLPADRSTQEFLHEMLETARAPLVLDAGALTALEGRLDLLARCRAPVILTPHPGEMARLLAVDSAAVQRDRITVARAVSERAGAVVVLKGASTVVAEPGGEVHVVMRGNAGMATAGTGDVLAGVIGGLAAQGVAPALCARAGAQLHARAGDIAADHVGEPGLVASDLIRYLPAAFRAGED